MDTLWCYGSHCTTSTTKKKRQKKICIVFDFEGEDEHLRCLLMSLMEMPMKMAVYLIFKINFARNLIFHCFHKHSHLFISTNS